MLKWFGFQSSASEGGESAASASDDKDAESSASIKDQDTGSERCISEVNKEKENDPLDDEKSSKSYGASSISGAFGILDILKLKTSSALKFLIVIAKVYSIYIVF